MAVWNNVLLSHIVHFNRTDAEFFKLEYELAFKKIVLCNGERLRTRAFITDGIHESPDLSSRDKAIVRTVF